MHTSNSTANANVALLVFTFVDPGIPVSGWKTEFIKYVVTDMAGIVHPKIKISCHDLLTQTLLQTCIHFLRTLDTKKDI